MPEARDAVATLHAWAAVASAALAAAIVLAAVLDQVGRIRGRRLVDRLILALIGSVLVAAVLGPLLVAGNPSFDPLHALYGVVAVAAVPVARAAAARGRPSRADAWLVAGGLVTLGVLLRLWATGG